MRGAPVTLRSCSRSLGTPDIVLAALARLTSPASLRQSAKYHEHLITHEHVENNGCWALVRIARGVAGESGMAKETDSAVAEAACLLQVSCVWPAATLRA